jgi:hypothetical protein
MKIILITITIVCAYAASVVHVPGVSRAKGCPPLCSVPL